MVRIAVSAILLCLTAGLAFAMRRSTNNPDSVFKKSLFRVKSVRFFPVASLAYAFFAVVIVFFGLLMADEFSGREQEKLLHENLVDSMMNFEKFNTGLDYPLMAIKRRVKINKEHRKILVLGDSFVWGYALTNINQIWWSIMSSELERRGYDCEVYAAAFLGASTSDEFRWLRDTALLKDLEPDLIIIGYVTNDHDTGMDMEYELINDPAMVEEIEAFEAAPMTENSNYQPDSIFPNLLLRVTERISYKRTDYIHFFAPIESGQLMNYEQYVLSLGEYMQQLRIPTIIIPTPEAPRKAFVDFYQDVLPLFEKAGLPVYNPLHEFIKQYPNLNNKYFSANLIDRHPGPATSWFLGKYAADVVEQEYTSILGEKRTKEKAYPIRVNDWLPLMLEPQAIQEGESVSQYTIEYPDQSSTPDFKNFAHGNFLTLPLGEKYVKLNFKYPVRLSSVKIEGEDLLSAEVYTLAINEALGFDDQKPVSLGKRSGGGTLVWIDGSERDVTSLLISAKTVDGKQASLTVTVEGEVALW